MTSVGGATRAQLAAAVRRPGFAYAATFALAGGFAGGAALGGTRAALLAPAALLALVLVVAYANARREGEHAFWTHLAGSLRLDYLGRVDELLPLTPTLGAGVRRRADAWMAGRDVWGAGLFTYFREHGRGDDAVDLPCRRTLAVVEVPAATGLFAGVYLYRGQTTDMAGHLRSRTRRVQLESAAFNERYLMLCAPEVGDIRVRELFTPSLIAWLAEHPLAPEVEIRGGAVLVSLDGHRAEAGTIVGLVDCARELARRLQVEVAEHELATGRPLPAR